MIKVFIVDDHKLFREGLKQILKEESDILVVGEAGSGHEALNKILNLDIDIIIMDISMPGQSGIEVLKQLHALKCKPSVLVLSMYPEEQYALRTIKLGASGYITKASAPEELIIALRKIANGGTYISHTIAEKLLFSLKENPEEQPHNKLSDREYQIFLSIASGKKITQIADELCLSVKTVSTYRMRILEKMNMKTNADLIHYALKHNLLLPND